MKILKLRFKNIHSLKGINEINFDSPPLSDTGIFAIIGPTGSGKSTILDAITLALYNKTPRIDNISKSTIDNYGAIITNNTTECFTEVEYQIKNKIYRSRWDIKKTRTGSLRDYEMSISSLPDNKIILSKKSKVPDKNSEIIGLNYQQFIKSIMLSQGEFSKFLKADVNERGKLLEKITGTEIYREIGKNAFNRYKLEEQKYKSICEKKEDIKLLSNDELAQLKQSLSQNENNIVEYNKKIQLLNKQYQNKKQINNIENDIVKINSDNNKLQNEINKFKPQIEILKNHEKLLYLKSDLVECKNLTNEHNKYKQETNTIKKNIINLEQNKSKLSKKYDSFVLKNAETNEEYEKIKPILKQVEELDIKIKQEQLIIRRINRTLNENKNEYKNLTNEYQKLGKTIKSDIEKKDVIENWLDNNKNEDLAKEIELIKKEVSNYSNKRKVLNTISKNLNNKQIFSKLKNISIDKKIDLINNIINENKLSINNISTELEEDTNFDILNQEKELLQRKKDATNKQLQYSENFIKNSKLIIQFKDKNTIFNNELLELNDYQTKLSNEIEITSKNEQELSIRLEREQLEAKYSDDRLLLKKDEACFLCGSTMHPYINQYNSKLNITKKEIAKVRRILKKYEKDIKSNEISISKIELNIKNNISQIENYNKENKNNKTDFDKINTKFSWENLINKNKNIEIYIEKLNEKDRDIAHKIKQIQKLQVLEKQQTELINLSEKMKDFKIVNDQISVYQQKYKTYLSKVTLLNIPKELQSILNKFEAKKIEFDSLTNTIVTNRKLLEEKSYILEKTKIQHAKIQNEYNNKTDEYNKIKKQRFDIFENKDTEKENNWFQTKLKNEDKELLKIKTEIIKIKSDLSNFINNETQIIDKTESIKQKLDNIQEILIPKINEIAYSSIDKALKSILPDKQAIRIKNRDEELQKRLASIIKLLETKNNEIDKFKKLDNTEISIEKINNNIQLYTNNLNKSNREIGIINNKFENNSQKQEQFNILKVKTDNQKKEYNRWDSLNKLIGDGEGKKFSKFAQELTLIQLIGLANKHLKSLNKRYIIKKGEKKTKDNLVVVDKYLANTERSVKTLSGGESFLLSLALALGLSDLAGQNTKIESLFIDEGFGSLDAHSLDIALSTLETLQNKTDRTIGVISHVQALKDRITTQIELKKIGAGYSVFEIHN